MPTRASAGQTWANHRRIWHSHGPLLVARFFRILFYCPPPAALASMLMEIVTPSPSKTPPDSKMRLYSMA